MKRENIRLSTDFAFSGALDVEAPMVHEAFMAIKKDCPELRKMINLIIKDEENEMPDARI